MSDESKYPNFEDVSAIQFNGWNFGTIYDWVRNVRGIYTADFKKIMELNGEIVHRNDWVVKNGDGTFSIMSNFEFEEKLEKGK